ncbi:MAG TPA: hypothetical protein PKW33_21640 [Anaerolineaceae bacterium]|nr:hypothetical protein [Anaerolineaceae bacterium]HPN54213.1 hypothetical protein [Anaerolineaceae bacterium]
MNTIVEHQFIQSFVRRERRERAQFELLSSRKRAAFLNRLCHNYKDILDMRLAHSVPASDSNSAGILKALRQKGAPDNGYVISLDDSIDGQELPLAAALGQVVGMGLPGIVICNPAHFCYFEAEQEAGSAPRFFLIRVEQTS